MEVETSRKAETPPSSLWAGGLLAVSLVIFQGFFTMTSLDISSLISVFSLALAIPILTYKIFVNTLRIRKYNMEKQSLQRASEALRTPYPELLLFILGILSVIVGIGAAFLHINWIAAIIFSICTLVLLVIFLIFHLQRLTE